MASNKSEQFEQSLKELGELVETLENGDLSLEQALKQFEKGVKLSQTCQKTLAKAEQKVEKLLQERNDD